MDEQLYQTIYSFLTTLEYSVDYSNLEKSYLQKEVKNYFVENNILFKRNKDEPQH
ncbi:3393_t:CDS:1, partial [Scutellospora calospora]